MSGKADHYWRCGCGGGHFLSVTWWPGDASRTDIEFEGYLEVEGDFRSGWRHRIAMTWRMLRSGHAETRVGLILSQAKAREIAAVLTEFADQDAPRDSAVPAGADGESPEHAGRLRPSERHGVVGLSRDEGRAMFDRRCRDNLGISGEEFLARWDAGEYASIPDGENGRVMHLAMLIPFAR